MAQTIKNLASGRLTSDITAVATSLSVYVGEGTSEEIKGVWPDTPFYATIVPNEPDAGVPNSLDSEIVKITAVSSDQNGNTILTATRAQRDTLARAFSAGAIITNAIYVEDAGFSIYSTEEKVVGTWIDGKPIYRKVLVGNATSSSVAVSIDDNDVDSIIKLDAYREVAGPPTDIIGGFYTSATDYFKYWYRKTTANICQIELRSSSGTYAYIIIVEFTKTTD